MQYGDVTRRQMTERAWNESDSQIFIDRGKIYTPRRDELLEAFLDLIPAEPDETFQIVELAPGAGWLSAGILERFLHASVLALDGSEEMLAETARALAPYPGRWETRTFQLQDVTWRAALPNDVRAIVSSLAIHHLKGTAKRDLFADLHDHLAPGGALLIADLVEPAGPAALRHMARAWDDDVERQSTELTGSPTAWEFFRDDHWNIYTWPDLEMDFPSPLVDQIDWLRQTGYTHIDIPWARAGHTLIAAYRS
jgi:tRNA (cmo5U34)-methyltransferase